MIRKATRADLPQLIALGEEFGYASQPAHGFSVDREKIIMFANDVVENPYWIVLVSEKDSIIDGFIAGLLTQIFFSKDIALQELIWYVKKGSRGLELYHAFAQAGKDAGAKFLVVGDKPDFIDMERIYKRFGHRVLERQWVREL